MLQLDDGRAELPELHPQQEAVVPLIVTTPAKTGVVFAPSRRGGGARCLVC
jgi:hypothetical protein